MDKIVNAVKWVSENWQVIGTAFLMTVGVITISATILGQIAKKLQDVCQNAEIDGYLGKIILVCGKVAELGLGILHLFPTFGTNPKTKEMKERLDQLEEIVKNGQS